MPDSSVLSDSPDPIHLQCSFVRGRNALLVQGDFTPLLTDYYLHLAQFDLRYDAKQDSLLKDGIAVIALFLASRPRNENAAWTVSWQDPAMNLFVTGSNRLGNLIGRVFTEDVKPREQNLLIAQLSVSGEEPRQSVIEVNTLDFLKIGEAFYRQSEQRPGRFFHLKEDQYALISAQPDCDIDWLESLDAEAILSLAGQEELGFLETREYRFECGCGLERILPIVVGLSEETLAESFAEGKAMIVNCPRCGARYSITEELLEAWQGDHEG